MHGLLGANKVQLTPVFTSAAWLRQFRSVDASIFYLRQHAPYSNEAYCLQSRDSAAQLVQLGPGVEALAVEWQQRVLPPAQGARERRPWQQLQLCSRAYARATPGQSV